MASNSLFLTNTFIILFLAIQIFLPTYYYYRAQSIAISPQVSRLLNELVAPGGASEQLVTEFLALHDERFAWRMFSPLHYSKCRIEFFSSNNTAIKLEPLFQTAWIDLLQMCRLSVMQSVTRHLCNIQPNQPPILYRRITHYDTHESKAQQPTRGMTVLEDGTRNVCLDAGIRSGFLRMYD